MDLAQFFQVALGVLEQMDATIFSQHYAAGPLSLLPIYGQVVNHVFVLTE